MGPTASGKSGLAIRLAQRFNGEVISADSRQVYTNLDMGTGKVRKDNANRKSQNAKSQRKMQNNPAYLSGGICHHLIDIASPKRQFTVAQYQKKALQTLSGIWRRERLPIVCGGTGQYIDALMFGQKFPAVKPNPLLRKWLSKKFPAELFRMLKKLDPHRARTIDPHNSRRLIRALEIVLATGKPVPVLRHPGLRIVVRGKLYPRSITLNRFRLPGSRSGAGFDLNDEVVWLGIDPPRKTLHRSIRKRLLVRMRQGMIAEVEKLKKQGVSSRRLEALGLEYRYINRFLEGKIPKTEMLIQLEHAIRRYAKRQMTWFRRNKRIRWVKNTRAAGELVKTFLKKE